MEQTSLHFDAENLTVSRVSVSLVREGSVLLNSSESTDAEL